MSTSIIDGTVAELVPGRSRGATKVFKSIRFQRADGTSETVTKAVVQQPLADELTPGAKGRFYLFKAFDLKGVHGVRTPDGRAVFAFPGGNRRIFLIAAIANLAWIVLRLFVDGGIPVLGLALLILSVVGWFLMGKGQAEAKHQFDADGGYSGSGAQPLTRPL